MIRCIVLLLLAVVFAACSAPTPATATLTPADPPTRTNIPTLIPTATRTATRIPPTATRPAPTRTQPSPTLTLPPPTAVPSFPQNIIPIIELLVPILFGALAGAAYTNYKVEEREKRATSARLEHLVTALKSEMRRNLLIAVMNGGRSLGSQREVLAYLPSIFQTSALDDALFGVMSPQLSVTLKSRLEGLALAIREVNVRIEFHARLVLADYSTSQVIGPMGERSYSPAGTVANHLVPIIARMCYDINDERAGVHGMLKDTLRELEASEVTGIKRSFTARLIRRLPAR